MFNRRQFITASTVVAISPTLLLEGCTLSQQDIENLINVALQSAAAVLAVAEPGAPWVADFQAAITALKTAEASWVGGGAIADVIAALNAVAAVAAAIPFTATYSPLIDVLIAGIDAVLAALPAPTTAPGAAVANATQPLRAHVTTLAVTYNHHGRASVNGMFGKPSVSTYKSRWNAAVAKNPALAAAKI
jgi:hypothetical protein